MQSHAFRFEKNYSKLFHLHLPFDGDMHIYQVTINGCEQSQAKISIQ